MAMLNPDNAAAKKEIIEEKIKEAIGIYRGVLGFDDEAIITQVMKRFSVSRDEAEDYVFDADDM